MKVITGAFKVLNLVGRLQCGKLKTELPAKSWLNASGFPRFKEQAKPFVPKALDQRPDRRHSNCSALRNKVWSSLAQISDRFSWEWQTAWLQHRHPDHHPGLLMHAEPAPGGSEGGLSRFLVCWLLRAAQQSCSQLQLCFVSAARFTPEVLARVRVS